MELQTLNNCCSTLYLYGIKSHSSYDISSKERFKSFLNNNRIILTRGGWPSAIIYICSNNKVGTQLRKIGFKKKCSFNGQYTGVNAPDMYILDIRSFVKDLNRIPLKQRIKNWVAKW